MLIGNERAMISLIMEMDTERSNLEEKVTGQGDHRLLASSNKGNR